jgi:phage terminase small subunit
MTDRKLTPKQEAFAQALATGVSQAQAYRKAFPASKRWKDATVWSEASRLAADPRVCTRVAELQAKAATAVVFTLADHLKRLSELSIGRAAGFYVQKTELTGKGGGPIETKQTRDLSDAELKEELARHGLQP